MTQVITMLLAMETSLVKMSDLLGSVGEPNIHGNIYTRKIPP